MSKTMVVSPIVSALVKSEDILGANRRWRPVNDRQKRFLEDFFSKRAELAGFSEKELRSWVSRVAAELNAILASEGFDIRLQNFAPNEFGVVSILDVLVEWLAEGGRSEIIYNGRNYPAVMMKPAIYGENERPLPVFGVFDSPSHPHQVACVNTRSGDRVLMTVADRALANFELIERIKEIRRDLRSAGFYDWLKFPMVDLDQEVDIGWLKGMRTVTDAGVPAVISQAFQQTKFKMNQFGARVKSAVALGIAKICIRKTMELVIDEPFFLWIERRGMSIPVMCAYIDETEWKDPGSLSEI